MARTRYTAEEILGHLRTIEIGLGNGLEQENVQLKRLVADLSLDNSILKEVAAGTF
jgi:hypothetical protein